MTMGAFDELDQGKNSTLWTREYGRLCSMRSNSCCQVVSALGASMICPYLVLSNTLPTTDPMVELACFCPTSDVASNLVYTHCALSIEPRRAPAACQPAAAARRRLQERPGKADAARARGRLPGARAAAPWPCSAPPRTAAATRASPLAAPSWHPDAILPSRSPVHATAGSSPNPSTVQALQVWPPVPAQRPAAAPAMHMLAGFFVMRAS